MDESYYDMDNERLVRREDDYYEDILHFRKEASRSSVISLMSLAGLESATEAFFFFQELQAGLAPIRILDDNADELWCRLDWCSVVLGLWVRRKGHTSGHFTQQWMSIMESWQFIIESTATMAICFALPSSPSQRVALYDDKRNVTVDRMLRDAASCDYNYIPREDQKLVNSVLRAARLQDWTIPLRHHKAFQAMISHLRSTIEKDHPRRLLLQQRRRGIKASDFEEFVADIEKETHRLLEFLTAEERSDLEIAFFRFFGVTLSARVVKMDLRYLQISQKLRFQWMVSSRKLQESIQEFFQEQVQEVLGHIITRKTHDCNGFPTPPIDKDLEDVLALGADIRGNFQGTKDSLLHRIASRNGLFSSFRALVAVGAPYTNDSEYAASPFHAAAGADNTEVIAFLLDRRLHSFAIDINLRDGSGRTPLHWAARNCCINAIDMMLKQPQIEIDSEDRHGFTPYLVAAKSGWVAVMSRLLQAKRIDCHHETHWSENALHFAAALRDNSLTYILRHIRDVNARDGSGKTPLHNAVEKNSGPNVSILLRKGADPSIMDDGGFTPLARACQARNLGPMKRLLRDTRSRIELVCSPPESFSCRCYEDCFKHPSPVTLVLHDLRYVGKKTIAHIRLALQIVLAAMPDLEVRDSKGQSVLSKVVKTIDARMLQDILNAGADINSRDKKGKSILHKAIVAVDEVSLQLLLEAGVDVNSQDCKGNTPMHKLLGPHFTQMEKLRMLLEWGANPDIKNHDGDDPVIANLDPDGKTWREDPAPMIMRHRMQIGKARKSLAKAEKRDLKSLPTLKKPKPSNPFCALTLEGDE